MICWAEAAPLADQCNRADVTYEPPTFSCKEQSEVEEESMTFDQASDLDAWESDSSWYLGCTAF